MYSPFDMSAKRCLDKQVTESSDDIMTLSDGEIRNRIVDDLIRDGGIDVSEIQVTVDKGKVTISGTVSSYTARNAITDAAGRIRDIVWFDNKTTVKHIPAMPPDPSIKETVLTYLATDSDMARTDIRVSVENGIVTLEGFVDEYWKKGEAEQIARGARGVSDIINRLTVVPTRSEADNSVFNDTGARERNYKARPNA
jgi:osmotically-inducible protein OsmY